MSFRLIFQQLKENIRSNRSKRRGYEQITSPKQIYGTQSLLTRNDIKERLAQEKEKYEEVNSNMVQGIDLMQTDVAFLSYNPSRPLTSPEVKLDSVCTAGLYELKKHRELKKKEKYEMGSEAYQHYKWYNHILRSELEKFGDSHTKLKIFHWHIESSNVEAFTIDGVLYKAVSVIISPTLEYWYCANAGKGIPHVWGCRERPNRSETNVTTPQLQSKPSPPKIILTLTSPTGAIKKVKIDGDKKIQPPSICRLDRNPQPSTSKGVSSSCKINTKGRRNKCESSEKLCNLEYCANNCSECKGRENPATIERKPKCACYITKKNGKYKVNRSCNAENSSPSCVSISEAIAVLNEKKDVLRGGEIRGLRTIIE